MRVAGTRWGEVTIKKQGEGKNVFDKTKPFSIVNTSKNYSLEEYFELLRIITNETENISFQELKNKIKNGLQKE